MPIPIYLAMTECEMTNCTALPPKIAWMSCLFSPFGTGIIGIPENLPPQSLLILSDRIPYFRHDPDLIVMQLKDAMEQLRCDSMLLDFQQPNIPQLQELMEKISVLNYKICVSESYSQNWDGPILIPPVPLDKSAENYLKKWKGREIWLEAELGHLQITVDEHGSNYRTLPPDFTEDYPYFCAELLCHYRQKVTNTAQFYLMRTADDLKALFNTAEKMGVTSAVGFYRELSTNIDNKFTG